MGKFENIQSEILGSASDRNIAFSDLRYFLEQLGFDLRIKGDHFIYTKEGVTEIINIQPNASKAKAYQVKQVRKLILKYRMTR